MIFAHCPSRNADSKFLVLISSYNGGCFLCKRIFIFSACLHDCIREFMPACVYVYGCVCMLGRISAHMLIAGAYPGVEIEEFVACQINNFLVKWIIFELRRSFLFHFLFYILYSNHIIIFSFIHRI